MNKILTYLLIIVVLVLALFWVLSQKPSHAVEDTRPEHVVNAEQLSLEFYNDEALANEQYLNRIIAVSGEVLKVEIVSGKTAVWLKGTSQGPNLRCLLSNRVDHARTEFQNNEKIRLKCVCTGLVGQIELMQCEEY